MEILYATVERLALTGFRALAWDIRVTGQEHLPEQGGAVLATNHISYLDYLFSGYAAYQRGRRLRFVAKQELFDIPVLGAALRALGHIPVDRAGQPSDAVGRAVEALRDGELIGMFPEGTISASFVPLPGKTGAARMAMGAGVPLIPGAVWGGHRILSKGGRGRPQRHLVATCDIGPPVAYDPGEDVRAVSDRLMAAIGELVDKAQRSYPQEPSGPGDRWWVPAHLGGTAPTPEEAEAIARREADDRRRRRAERRRRGSWRDRVRDRWGGRRGRRSRGEGPPPGAGTG